MKCHKTYIVLFLIIKSISGAEVSKTFRHWCRSVSWTLWHQCRNVLGRKCLRSEVSVHLAELI